MPAEFDRYAAEYDQLLRDPIRDGFAPDSLYFHQRKWELIRDFFHRAGRPTAPLHWLDVGSGRGELLSLGRSSFAHATGCDPAAAMASASSTPTVLQPDPNRLPFPDSSFDFATSVCVFHHVALAHRPELAAELARVLTPGGIACIIEHNPRNPVTRAIVRRTPVDADAILLPAAESAALLTQAGLRLLDTRYFLYFPQVLYRVFGRLEHLLARLPAGGQYAIFAERL